MNNSMKKRKWKQRMGWFLAGLLMMVILGYSSSAWGYLHPIKMAVAPLPGAYQLPFDPVSFTSADGVRLDGWLIPHPHPKAVIILCHGYRSQRGAMLPCAEFLHKEGYACLLFDFRWHGTSGGSCTTLGYKEKGDVLAAVKFLAAHEDYKKVPIGLIGVSMGASAGIMAAAEEPRIQAVIADSPYANLHNATSGWFQRQFGRWAFMGAPVEWLGEMGIGARSSEVSPEKAVSHLAPRPFFLIHGEADSIVSFDNAEAVDQAAHEPKQFWHLPGVEHVQMYAAAQQEYERRVVSFFNHAFSK